MKNSINIYHKRSILQPTFSNFSFNSVDSALDTPFLITTGTLSTYSLASFKPKPKIALTSLIILIFEAASKLVN